jgi:SagB-type dehydrogenase family enzyme
MSRSETLSPTWVLSLREGTTVASGGEGGLSITAAHSRIALRQLTPGTAAALRQLTPPGEAQGRLAASVLNAEGAEGLARWYYHLQELARRGFLLFSVREDNRCLATLEPIAPGFSFPCGGGLGDRPYVLSRFAYLRRLGEEMVVESPRSFARFIIHDPRVAALVHTLARPASHLEIAARVPALTPEATADLVALLFCAGMVVEMTDGGRSTEETDAALQCWEFHDLLFHSRSREGRHDGPVGATYRLLGTLPPPPALGGSVTGAASIELYRPDLEQLQSVDLPFARVVEERRSLREYGNEPITLRQLGEFLYRTVRVKTCREEEIETGLGPLRMEFTSRPYPAGGSLYELEVYPVISACGGLSPGLYHYDPLRHKLGRVTERNPGVEQLLREAAWATGMDPAQVQVLLILAARFPRVSWKYSTLAYALTLKHVGVVYQTMYLTATAMGLAPCAIGTGDSDVFARAAGTSFYEATSVGEFLLGSNGPPRDLSP